MSLVNNYILVTEAGSDYATVRELNKKFKLQFVRVDHHAGGSKAIEWSVYMAATNNRTEEAVLGHVRSMTWSGSVQIMVAGQEDEKWRMPEL